MSTPATIDFRAFGDEVIELEQRRHRVGGPQLLFAFLAAIAETERENIRESTLEGLDTAARKGKHGGRPPVITEDMLHPCCGAARAASPSSRSSPI
ncbi:recombinase family protein [Streptomyces sp. SID4917]|uniref:recombinase family protein n=1 Tax=unclassified Streptomyces TaxID=2593676 RepID=UPI00081F1A21|nr:Resolvase, N terminal domain [Streptomyces sp. MnatMP-M17]